MHINEAGRPRAYLLAWWRAGWASLVTRLLAEAGFR